jgi:hypothetical protein
VSSHGAFVAGVGAAAQPSNAPAQQHVVRPCGAASDPAKGWVQVVVTDEDGEPVSGVLCRITTPDGKVEEATTGPDGSLSLSSIPDGTCKIEFPDHDRRALEPS